MKIQTTDRAQRGEGVTAIGAVVDKDIDGWRKEKEQELDEKYSQVVQVGKHEVLTERSSDQEIAAFCRDNEFDMYTSDMRFYEHYFKAGVDSVRITKFDWWKNKYILLIQIGERN